MTPQDAAPTDGTSPAGGRTTPGRCGGGDAAGHQRREGCRGGGVWAFRGLGLLLAALTRASLGAADGLDPAARMVAAIGVLMATWWTTEALPLSATALIPIVAFPVLGSASVGGLGTLLGSPPDAIVAGYLADELGEEIGFLHWMQLGVPLVVVFIAIAWVLITRVPPLPPRGDPRGHGDCCPASGGRMVLVWDDTQKGLPWLGLQF